MSPFIAYHATARRHRFGIRRYGLLPSEPGMEQPYGVYVFNDDFGHATFTRSLFVCRWSWWQPMDLWRVAYVGPLSPDRYVENGLVLHNPVPPEYVTLVTPDTRNI